MSTLLLDINIVRCYFAVISVNFLSIYLYLNLKNSTVA